MEIIIKNRVVKAIREGLLSLTMLLLTPAIAAASEANLKIPNLSQGQNNLLLYGIVVCILGMLFGFYQFMKVKKIRAHKSMLDVSDIIYETCKTYLIQQGKFLAYYLLLSAHVLPFTLDFLQETALGGVLLILAVDSYRYSWFLWCCLVWYPHEYSGKQQNGIRFPGKKTAQTVEHSSRCRNEHRCSSDLC